MTLPIQVYKFLGYLVNHVHENIVGCIFDVHFNNNNINPYMYSCSTGNPADGSDTDDAKLFITSTNKKAAIKVSVS